MKNIKSLLLLALTVPFCTYANEEENQNQIDTSGMLVQSAAWLESMIADLQDSIPEVSLEEYVSQELIEATKEGASNALKITVLPHTQAFPWLMVKAWEHFGLSESVNFGDSDPYGVLYVTTLLATLGGSASLGLGMDFFSLVGSLGWVPELPYMPSLKTRLQLAVVLTAWDVANKMMAAEANSSEEL